VCQFELLGSSEVLGGNLFDRVFDVALGFAKVYHRFRFLLDIGVGILSCVLLLAI